MLSRSPMPPAARESAPVGKELSDEARRDEQGDDQPASDPGDPARSDPPLASVEGEIRIAPSRSRPVRASRPSRGRSTRSESGAPSARSGGRRSRTASLRRPRPARRSAPTPGPEADRGRGSPRSRRARSRPARAPRRRRTAARRHDGSPRSLPRARARRGPVASCRRRRRASSTRERLQVDLLAQPRAEGLQRALGVVAAAVEAPVDEPLHPRRAPGRNSAATTSVETAIARSEPPANDENSAWPPSTRPT